MEALYSADGAPDRAQWTPFLLNSGQQPYTPANMSLEEHSDVPLAEILHD